MRARNEALLAWYDTSRRDLPWRGSSEPWAILVSEIMSHQTQVSRVASRFGEFMERFPSPEALADASVAETLSAWSGLGYNRRGLRLREAATEIAAFGWPTTSSTLERLPGVGPYTAAAVACFAFGEQVAAVDTNLRRVLTRWRGQAGPPRELSAYATSQLPAGRAADWNQAVMDLGATVCRPRQPECRSCPVASWCVDPAAYERPSPQSPFQGSRRQARGMVIKVLLAGGATTMAIAEHTGLAAPDVEEATQSLVADGLVNGSGGSGWFLPE